MSERIEVEYWAANDKVLLKRYFKIDPPDEEGNTVGMMMTVLDPEQADQIAIELQAAVAKSDARR